MRTCFHSSFGNLSYVGLRVHPFRTSAPKVPKRSGLPQRTCTYGSPRRILLHGRSAHKQESHKITLQATATADSNALSPTDFRTHPQRSPAVYIPSRPSLCYLLVGRVAHAVQYKKKASATRVYECPESSFGLAVERGFRTKSCRSYRFGPRVDPLTYHGTPICTSLFRPPQAARSAGHDFYVPVKAPVNGRSQCERFRNSAGWPVSGLQAPAYMQKLRIESVLNSGCILVLQLLLVAHQGTTTRNCPPSGWEAIISAALSIKAARVLPSAPRIDK